MGLPKVQFRHLLVLATYLGPGKDIAKRLAADFNILDRTKQSISLFSKAAKVKAMDGESGRQTPMTTVKLIAQKL